MTIHAYSSDHGERTRILIVIGSLSVVAAWLLHLVLGYLPVTVPWWIDTPSVLGFFALIRTTFDKTLWRNKMVRKVLGITIPDLNGSWKGQLFSSYTDHSSPLDADLIISQNWTGILISLETATSVSRSRAAAFVIDQPGRISLIYEYLCEPRPVAIDTMHTHRGTAELHISSNGTLLEGEYYTGRDRQTYGTLNLQRVTRTTVR
ncbi:MAG: hypothetical protein HW384_1342 [Dehalococcoidia bacterium]|nr:hypothetical protein [Dehalococcoidia bacterium]